MTGHELPPDDRPPQDPDGRAGAAGGPRAGEVERAQLGRRLVVVVAVLEACALLLAAATTVLAGLRGGSLPLAAGVAAAALAAAWLLVEVARGFAKGRRWPTGIFVTVQLLVALTALSLGSRSLLTLTDNPRIGGLTLLALLVAGVGLLGAVLLARTAGDAGDEDMPVL